MIRALILVHVGSGAAWLLVSAAALVQRAGGRWVVALQAVASSATLVAGILLWHALHSGGMGAPERLLVVGTVCAFVALGLQFGVAVAGDGRRLTGAGLGLHAASVAFLAIAAAAMLASRFVS